MLSENIVLQRLPRVRVFSHSDGASLLGELWPIEFGRICGIWDTMIDQIGCSSSYGFHNLLTCLILLDF